MTTTTPAAGEPSEREAFEKWARDNTDDWAWGEREIAWAAWQASGTLNAPTPSPSVMINRERFETWCISVHGYLAPPKWNDEENDYVGAEARMMWDVWSAAIIAHAPSPSETHMIALVERLMQAAFDVLHHDGNEEGETPEDTYNHATLRKKFAAIIANAQPGDSAGFVLTEEERKSVEVARRFLGQHPFPFSDERSLYDLLAIISRAIGAKS
jgi:hypothetical protein